MSEGIVYADVKFKKQPRTEGKYATASTANDATYSEISIPRTGRNQPSTDPNAGDPDSQEGSKVKPGVYGPVRVVLVTLFCVLLMSAVIGLGVFYIICPQAQCSASKNLKDSMEKNLTAEDKRPKCAECWVYNGKKCYYFSNNSMTWNQSKDNCISMGGHLVVIDSKEEQKFLDYQVGVIMSTGEDKFWIGLTDQREEGTWLWVDNTTLQQNKSFWTVPLNGMTEPDNWQGENYAFLDGEDCARMGEKGGTHNDMSWFDANCCRTHRRICEAMSSA